MATRKTGTSTAKIATRPAAPSKTVRAAAAPAPGEIAARAYEIWDSSGRPDGQHEEHWLRAERELREKLAR